MSTNTESTTLYDFTDCHVVIIQKLLLVDALAGPLGVDAPKQAADVLAFFDDVVRRHHLDEEQLLFVAAAANAQAGVERDMIESVARRLTSEHRQIEALLDEVKPGLEMLRDNGRNVLLDQSKLERLSTIYKAHAAYEEASFLPQAQVILERAGPALAQLGLRLHMRDPVVRTQLHFGRWT
jgi:hemerythrin-like domain-containing protein